MGLKMSHVDSTNKCDSHILFVTRNHIRVPFCDSEGIITFAQKMWLQISQQIIAFPRSFLISHNPSTSLRCPRSLSQQKMMAFVILSPQKESSTWVWDLLDTKRGVWSDPIIASTTSVSLVFLACPQFHLLKSTMTCRQQRSKRPEWMAIDWTWETFWLPSTTC